MHGTSWIKWPQLDGCIKASMKIHAPRVLIVRSPTLIMFTSILYPGHTGYRSLDTFSSCIYYVKIYKVKYIYPMIFKKFLENMKCKNCIYELLEQHVSF